MIEQLGGVFIFDDRYELTKNEDWEILFNSQKSISMKKMIFTTGIGTAHSNYWSFLKMHAVKGQILILKTETSIPFQHAVSALGYFSKMDNNTLVYGSTYEHKFDHHKADEKGQNYMLHRFASVLPDLAKKSNVIGNWAGIRASTTDRKPYIGDHHTAENCYIFAGLGSKGLLYSSVGANILVEHILNQTSIPSELDIKRLNKNKGLGKYIK